MKIRDVWIFVIFIPVIFSLLSCTTNKDTHGLKSNELLLAGSDLSKHDRDAGIIQASPGIEYTSPPSGVIDIPSTDSLLRFKLFDDQVSNPDTNGLVKLILRTDNLNSVFAGFSIKRRDDVTIELNIEKICIFYEKSPSKKRIKDKIETYYPTVDEAKIFFNNHRTYTMVVKGISLPEGNYNSITVYFKRDGKFYDNDKNKIYPVRLSDKTIAYHKKFSVNKGRITTLSVRSIKDRIENTVENRNEDKDREKDRIKNAVMDELLGSLNANRYICWTHKWHSFVKYKRHIMLMLRHFISEDPTITDPVSQVFIRYKQLSAVNDQGVSILLNDKETEFELLTLRNGAVALMGSNAIAAGDYRYFELQLDTGHRVIVDDKSYPLIIENWLYDNLRFMGPFDLRGGRITEVFIHFDPNRSLFYVRNKGYIMEPDISVTSVVSLTPIQENRLVESLGMLANQVMSQAELIFQGAVSKITPVLANNIYGKKMIYSDVDFLVEDRLRGTINNNSYTLRSIGGSYNGIDLKVSGMPEFTVGEKDIVFLRNYNGRMSVVHGEYGKVVMP
ncbi:MAG: hypothetical protein A2W19_11060 [Spirochaetes bacterium RBG_16_49_21]|nr:MAG: hypothetical protein A2W19_11060 [Spirochaetes bacterium RBG_16_49_21]